MIEQPVRFGPDGRLVGTLTRPAGRDSGWAVILTNAGVIHRVGPHRINVKIGRCAAELGCTSLRFDLSGLGDSRPAQNGQPWEEQAVSDLRTAIDYVQSATRANRFAIIGICSGADNGLAAALDDSRVAALFMVDGYAFPTWKTSLVRAVRALRPAHLLRRLPYWLSEKSARLLATLVRRFRGNRAELKDGFARSIPAPATFARQMQQLVDRGVAVHILYSGSMHASYNYAGQFANVFGRERFFEHVQCDYARDIDHTVTTLHAQRLLVMKIKRWLQMLISDPAPAGQAGTDAPGVRQPSGASFNRLSVG